MPQVLSVPTQEEIEKSAAEARAAEAKRVATGSVNTPTDTDSSDKSTTTAKTTTSSDDSGSKKKTWHSVADPAPKQDHTWHEIAPEAGTAGRNLPGPAPFSPSNTDYYQYGRPGTNDMGPSGSWSKPKAQVNYQQQTTEPPAAPGAKKTTTSKSGGTKKTGWEKYQLPEETGIVDIPDPSKTYSEGPNTPHPDNVRSSYPDYAGNALPEQNDFPSATDKSYPNYGDGDEVKNWSPNLPLPNVTVPDLSKPYSPKVWSEGRAPDNPVPPGQGTHPDTAWNPGPITNRQFARLKVPSGTWIESPPGHVWQVA